jgi:hypothetical protein
MRAALTLALQVLYPDMHPDRQQALDGEVDEIKRSSIVSHIKFPEWGFSAHVATKVTVHNV